MKWYLRALLVLPLLSACSGGGSGSAPPAMSNAPFAAASTRAVTTAEPPDANVAPQALIPASSSDRLYVGNTGNNSITVYAHDAQGNAAPLAVISGPQTELNGIGQLSQDAAGNLYVANRSPVSVLVFAHGANGNVAPIRKLAGPLTTLHLVEALTVDKATGKLFVMDADIVNSMWQGASQIVRFAPNAGGNTAPYARSGGASHLEPATQIASDSAGRNIIEAHTAECCSASNFGISTIFKQFANATSPAQSYGITWFSNTGVADDPTTKTYLVNAGGIYRFAETTVGHGSYPDSSPPAFAPGVVSIITSDTCGSQLAVAPGPYPNTYVTHSTAAGCAADAVYVYPNAANGNASPLRILSGPATRLNKPSGIYEGA